MNEADNFSAMQCLRDAIDGHIQKHGFIDPDLVKKLEDLTIPRRLSYSSEHVEKRRN